MVVGERFGKLTLVELVGRSKHNKPIYSFRCDCGEVKNILLASVKNGRTKSCGCIRKAHITKRNTRHGMHGEPEYKIWAGMKQRCNSPKAEHYDRYGGRGIKVSDEWNDYPNFIRSMGKRPDSSYTLERVDNNKGYCAENCVWATKLEQGSNKSNNRKYEYFGEQLILPEIARRTGLSRECLYARLNRGWDEHTAFTTPAKK